MTLLELIIACAILLILASAAMPVARFTVKRQKEAELRRELREMRDAIDRYKDAADRNLIRVEAGTRRLSARPGDAGEGRGYGVAGRRGHRRRDHAGATDRPVNRLRRRVSDLDKVRADSMRAGRVRRQRLDENNSLVVRI